MTPDDSQVVRRRVIVVGRVQGVYFRDTCRRLAAQRQVAGWVRNLPDETVEAVFEGSPDGVRRMVEWAHSGPPHARVDRVQEYAEQPAGLSGFHQR